LVLLGFLALVPTFIKKKFGKKMNVEDEPEIKDN